MTRATLLRLAKALGGDEDDVLAALVLNGELLTGPVAPHPLAQRFADATGLVEALTTMPAQMRRVMA